MFVANVIAEEKEKEARIKKIKIPVSQSRKPHDAIVVNGSTNDAKVYITLK